MTSTHDQGVPPPTPTEARYIAVQKSPEFQDLRRRYRGFVLPVTDFAQWMQYVAYALPVTHGIAMLQQLMLRGAVMAH